MTLFGAVTSRDFPVTFDFWDSIMEFPCQEDWIIWTDTLGDLLAEESSVRMSENC